MADDTPSKQSFFDFFGLPCELRDLIFLFSRDTTADSNLDINFTVTTPNTHLLLVSQQFNEEYSDACNSNLTLTVCDTGYDTYLPPVPQQAKTAKFLHLNLIIFCNSNCHSRTLCGIPREITAHLELIRHILIQLSSVRVIGVSLYMRPHKEKASAREAISVGAAELAGSDDRVEALNVYMFGEDDQTAEDWGIEELWAVASRFLIGEWQETGEGEGKMVFFGGEKAAEGHSAHEAGAVEVQ